MWVGRRKVGCSNVEGREEKRDEGKWEGGRRGKVGGMEERKAREGQRDLQTNQPTNPRDQFLPR